MVTYCHFCVCVEMSQLAQYINNTKIEVGVCQEANIQGAINVTAQVYLVCQLPNTRQYFQFWKNATLQ